MPEAMDLENLRRLKRNASDPEAVPAAEKARVIVGLGTCGIAAGGRGILQAVMDELQRRGVPNVSVETAGCVGLCQHEPLLDVVRPGEERVTYGRVTSADVSRIVEEHLLGGSVVQDLVVRREV